MRFSTVILSSAALAGLGSACKQQPVGDTPSGNPISAPGLAEQVPAGTPFTITWQPTTPGSVSIVLLQGPSTNVVPIDCIVDSIPNTGTFVWTPSADLKPDVTHYGLQIIVDGTGQYQYSTQFGISNPSPKSATTHSTTTKQHTKTATEYHSETSTGYALQTTSLAVISQISDGQVQGHTVDTTISTATHPTIISTLSLNATQLTVGTAPQPTVASTGALQHNSTHLTGTKTMTVPKTLQSSTVKNTTQTGQTIANATATASSPASTSAASSSPLAAPSSGAAHLAAAGGLVAGLGAMFALML